MPTDPKRVKEIFLGATEQPDEAARVTYLDRACGGDAGLRDRVEALLRCHDPAGSFLATPAAALPDPGHAGTLALDSSCPGGPPSPDHDDESAVLQFLTPSTRPDSLGRIGHYEVLEFLGKGGFGIVFRAFDETLQRAVAVKVLAPRLAATSAARKRFLREARSSAKVRHEHVVQVYAVEEQPLPYLVMEFIPGETLQQRLDRTGPLDTAEVVRIGWQIAGGLAAAHATGVIHRDIKPGNVLIEAGPHQHIKITDFGLARAADDASLTQSGLVAGTPMFMAPEQARGDTLDHRADLFSLGSVLYTMCSGRAPFRANNTLAVLKRVAEDTPRPIPEIIPEVPQWLCDLITRLHAKKPEDRVGTAKEVSDLLARGLAAMPQPATVPALPAVTPGTVEIVPQEGKTAAEPVASRKPARALKSRPHTRRWAAAAAVFLLLLGGLGFTEATGITAFRGTVIRLLSPEGTLVVEVDDPGVSVKIDGSDLVITGAGAREIRLKPGNYKVEASKGGKVVCQELVTVTTNGKQVVRVSREALPSEAKATNGAADAAAWERAVAGLSAAQQVKFVAARMQELNPGYDGNVEPTIEDGLVTGLEFSTEYVSDISPVHAFTNLRDLSCSPGGGKTGKLIDLSPLRGLPLTHLTVHDNPVSDLSPLKGMKLMTLHCSSTKVTDLSPLRGMPLEKLDCGFTRVADLSPLKGMKLREADFQVTEVADLAPLQGMPLKALVCYGLRVSDLSPLKGMPLELLNCDTCTLVSDLSPLKGMPLIDLGIPRTNVTDLTPLKGMITLKRLSLPDPARLTDLSPLKGLALDALSIDDIKAERDADTLRATITAKTINGKPAEEFWRSVEQK